MTDPTTYQFIPRGIYFKHGICIGAGFSAFLNASDTRETMYLPTDHYDFLGPIKVVGLTKEQIEIEINKYK